MDEIEQDLRGLRPAFLASQVHILVAICWAICRYHDCHPSRDRLWGWGWWWWCQSGLATSLAASRASPRPRSSSTGTRCSWPSPWSTSMVTGFSSIGSAGTRGRAGWRWPMLLVNIGLFYQFFAKILLFVLSDGLRDNPRLFWHKGRFWQPQPGPAAHPPLVQPALLGWHPDNLHGHRPVVSRPRHLPLARPRFPSPVFLPPNPHLLRADHLHTRQRHSSHGDHRKSVF